MAKRKQKRSRKNWSSEEIRRLRKIFRNLSTADVAKTMRRSFASIQAKAFVLNLRKTKKYLNLLQIKLCAKWLQNQSKNTGSVFACMVQAIGLIKCLIIEIFFLS